MDNRESLIQDWLANKSIENDARKARIKIEKELEKIVDVPKEGSKTHDVGQYKLTVTQPITRKIHIDRWHSVSHKIDQNFHPVKTKIEADATGCKYLAQNEPEMWKLIADAFETHPGKVSFAVKVKS